MDPWWCEAIAWWRGLVQAGYSPDRVYEWAAGRWGYHVAYDLSVAASASECSSSASVAGAVFGHTGDRSTYGRAGCRVQHDLVLLARGCRDGHVALAAPRHGGRGQSEAEAAAEAALAGASMVQPHAQGTVSGRCVLPSSQVCRHRPARAPAQALRCAPQTFLLTENLFHQGDTVVGRQISRAPCALTSPRGGSHR